MRGQLYRRLVDAVFVFLLAWWSMWLARATDARFCSSAGGEWSAGVCNGPEYLSPFLREDAWLFWPLWLALCVLPVYFPWRGCRWLVMRYLIVSKSFR